MSTTTTIVDKRKAFAGEPLPTFVNGCQITVMNNVSEASVRGNTPIAEGTAVTVLIEHTAIGRIAAHLPRRIARRLLSDLHEALGFAETNTESESEARKISASFTNPDDILCEPRAVRLFLDGPDK